MSNFQTNNEKNYEYQIQDNYKYIPTSGVPSENEQLNLINSLNSKISEMSKLLQQKDNLIITLKHQAQTCESYKNQISNLKNQLGVFEEKFNLVNSENSKKEEYYVSQIQAVSESENKVKTQIFAKDKLLMEYYSTINEQEKLLNQQKKQIMEKDCTNTELKRQIEEIQLNMKSLLSKAELSKEEIHKFKLEQEKKLLESNSERNRIEEKANQLVDIIKHQSKELNELGVQLQIQEKEKKKILKINLSFQKNIEELISVNNDLQSQSAIYKEIKEKLSEAEENLTYLQDELEKQKIVNLELQKENEEIYLKYNELNGKYSEEELLDLRKTVEKTNDEIEKLKILNQNLENTLKLKQKACEHFEKSLQEIGNFYNHEIQNILTWIENYFKMEKAIEIPEIPKNNLYLDKSNESINTLKKLLYQNLKNFQKDYFNNLKDLEKYKNENTLNKTNFENANNSNINYQKELKQKNFEIEKFINEVDILKKQIIIREDLEKKLKKEYFDLINKSNSDIDKIFDKLRLNIDNILLNTNINDKDSCEQLDQKNKKKQIEEFINITFDLIRSLKTELESTSKLDQEMQKSRNENDKLKKDINELRKKYQSEYDQRSKDHNDILKKIEIEKHEEIKNLETTFKKSIEKLKNLIGDKDQIIEQTKSENEILRNQIEHLDKNYQDLKKCNKDNEIQLKENLENLTNSYKILDKKYNQLIQENELKENQIKSLENLIDRRNKDIQEIKECKINFDEENFNKKLKELEQEKENLVKENLNLFSITTNLTKQIKNRDSLVTNSTEILNEKHKMNENLIKEYEMKLKNYEQETKKKESLISHLIEENKSLTRVNSYFEEAQTDHKLESKIKTNPQIFNQVNSEFKGVIIRKKNK